MLMAQRYSIVISACIMLFLFVAACTNSYEQIPDDRNENSGDGMDMDDQPVESETSYEDELAEEEVGV